MPPKAKYTILRQDTTLRHTHKDKRSDFSTGFIMNTSITCPIYQTFERKVFLCIGKKEWVIAHKVTTLLIRIFGLNDYEISNI